MTKQHLPQFVRDLLAAPPMRGGGLHPWLFRIARVLHPYRDREEIIALLAAATADQPVPIGEIEEAVDNSKAVAWRPGQRPTYRAAQWPEIDREKREAAIAAGYGLVDLWEQSPWRIDDNKSHAEEIIDHLFSGNPLLCVGKSKSRFATRPREEWRGRLADAQLIVPSPMSATTGRTRKDTESAHSLENTGPRRFLVIEQDTGTIDEQAAVLLHLAQIGPMVLAVHSGGKSIHGWFFCEGQSEERLLRFMRYAVSLGADHQLWSRCQFARMPDGMRDSGKRQTVYFLNPEVLR